MLPNLIIFTNNFIWINRIIRLVRFQINEILLIYMFIISKTINLNIKNIEIELNWILIRSDLAIIIEVN